MLLGQLAGKLTRGNGFDFCFCGCGHGIFPLGSESMKSPILRYFPQDKGGLGSKKRNKLGLFADMRWKTPKNGGFRHPPKAKEPRTKHPRLSSRLKKTPILGG